MKSNTAITAAELFYIEGMPHFCLDNSDVVKTKKNVTFLRCRLCKAEIEITAKAPKFGKKGSFI